MRIKRRKTILKSSLEKRLNNKMDRYKKGMLAATL